MYKNYIFDLYGTLVDIRTNENSTYLWKNMQEFYGFHGALYNHLELKRAYLRLCKEEEKKFVGKENYEITIDNVFENLYKEKGINPSEELVRCTCEIFRITSTKFVKTYEGVLEFLDELKSKNKNVFLLSNAQKSFTEPELRFLGLYEKFDDIFISSTEKCKKPSEDFFNKLIKKHNINIGESIMIGNDGTSDIAGANKVGMDSLYIHTEISPVGEDGTEVDATYKILDGDFCKISNLILK